MPTSVQSSPTASPRPAGVADIVPSNPPTPREQLLEQPAITLPAGTPFTPPEASLDSRPVGGSVTSPDTHLRENLRRRIGFLPAIAASGDSARAKLPLGTLHGLSVPQSTATGQSSAQRSTVTLALPSVVNNPVSASAVLDSIVCVGSSIAPTPPRSYSRSYFRRRVEAIEETAGSLDTSRCSSSASSLKLVG